MTTLETKKEVFYVRCRPSIKKAVYAKMQADGFYSMADWFDQFVRTLTEKEISGKTRSKKKRV